MSFFGNQGSRALHESRFRARLAALRATPRPAESKFQALPVTPVGTDGVFEGYASLFGVADLSKDIVEAGAFAASLARRGLRACACCGSTTPRNPSASG